MKTILFTGLFLATALTAFATILDNFHNIPLSTFLRERDSFKAKGFGPRTFSIFNSPVRQQAFVAGAFDSAHAKDVLYPDLDEIGLGQVITKMAKQNFYARSLSSSVIPGDGVVMLSAIFTQGPDATVAIFSGDDDRFASSYQKWVAQRGYRPLVHVQWPELGTNRHQTTFIKDGKPFVFYFNLDEATFARKGAELGAQGWEIDFFQVTTNTANQPSYNAIWLKAADSAYQYFYDMDANQYQQHWNELTAQGYQVKQVFGYGPKGERYGAIFTKP